MTTEQLDQLLLALGTLHDDIVLVLGGLGFGFGSLFCFAVVWLVFVWRGR